MQKNSLSVSETLSQSNLVNQNLNKRVNKVKSNIVNMENNSHVNRKLSNYCTFSNNIIPLKCNVMSTFIFQLINKRIKQLENIVNLKSKALENSPIGYINGRRYGKRYVYYYRKDYTNDKWNYIKNKNLKSAKLICQRDYDRKALQSASDELKILKEVSEYYSDARHNAYEYIYNDLPESFKPIVTPVQQPAQVRLERWKTQEFEKKGFYEDGPKYFSDNNEQMRSKSELLIANMLKKYGIPYIYEKPLKLKGYGIVYPDFTLYDFVNDQEIYWEHLGMLDNSEYMDNAVAKIQDYESNGCFPGDRLILSFESGRAPLNLKLIESQIKRLQRCIPENYD